MSDNQLGCINDLEDGTTWAEGWLGHPKLKHICMCHAVHSLVCHHVFSIPDMLRINDFWVEASIKVQHITDQTSKRWKNIDYDSQYQQKFGKYVKNQLIKQSFYPMPRFFIGYYIPL